ncbi:DUF2256 and DUF3253 domain-containing protein [Kineococcus rhizosphaerae]|uniref:DUF2256 and DUF3253 domain-containing protein n=1 Tax=Kineococcus rhizosphaerae TaxID=559628 RepID=A0A2T0QZA6_9ACTN|nr:DUF2256 and DUF3253 domain-containing protein [Kineococcus rhizosphaerae]PRY11832.1 hypothetical protein CLV37_112131 [Kineococcus rhizosphaerae]
MPAQRTRGELPTKDCAVCGRTITWRKKWERDWDQVRYCSDACRRRAKSSAGVDADLEDTLRRLLTQRGASKTVCPSEVARAVGGEDWRELMEPARSAARRLVAAGEAEITQGGKVVDPSTAKGPIRVRLR